MREFVTSAGFLPVRTSLVEEFKEFDEEVQVYVKQAAVIPEHRVREVTHPDFAEVNEALLNQLDLAFVGGQSPEVTLENRVGSAGLEPP